MARSRLILDETPRPLGLPVPSEWKKNDKKLKLGQEGADDHYTAAHRGIVAEKRYFRFFHPTPSACGAVD
jgi:hypothetical protein